VIALNIIFFAGKLSPRTRKNGITWNVWNITFCICTSSLNSLALNRPL